MLLCLLFGEFYVVVGGGGDYYAIDVALSVSVMTNGVVGCGGVDYYVMGDYVVVRGVDHVVVVCCVSCVACCLLCVVCCLLCVVCCVLFVLVVCCLFCLLLFVVCAPC